MEKLQGSEKQIAWAAKIKDKKIRELKALLAGVRPLKGHEKDKQCIQDAELYKKRVVRGAELQVSAQWWIDNKDMSRLDLLTWVFDTDDVVNKYKTRFLEKYAEVEHGK